MRVSEFRRLLVGLASTGWRPDEAQLATIVERSFPQLSSQFLQVGALV